MTPQRLWADIEPAPAKRPRRRPGRAMIRAAEEFAGVVAAALASVGADAVERRGRRVVAANGRLRFAVVVRCDE